MSFTLGGAKPAEGVPAPTFATALTGSGDAGNILGNKEAPKGFSITPLTPATTQTGGDSVNKRPTTTKDTQKQQSAILSTATTTTQSADTPTSIFNFSQLEEHINKWTSELEEQEKMFTNQATQINAWDKLLIANNDKIVALNEAVQKVKADQQTLEHELEFIATQHEELEESIAPLQKDFSNMPQVDIERTQTYNLVENLDTQLKQMSEDLKEVIDYLNEANRIQDNTDPIVQIGKILNAHMSSLQWIESSSSAIASKIDDISEMHENLKRDSERSFRLTYYE